MISHSKLLITAPMVKRSILNHKLKTSNLYPSVNYLNQFRSSHGRTMFIRPGKFYTKKYFDMLVLIY